MPVILPKVAFLGLGLAIALQVAKTYLSFMGNHVGTVKLRKLLLILPLIGTLWCDAAFARQVAGSYLAARQAGYLGDFEASALTTHGRFPRPQ